MESEYAARIRELEAEIVAMRRDLHEHAEHGWTECWTTAYIAGILEKEGYAIRMGADILDADARMGLPDDAVLQAAADRALAQGADPVYVERTRGGFTGVVADLLAGDDVPAPRIALRFDIDALPLSECPEADHRPVAEGFASANERNCHACGHDGNTAIGLGLAKALAGLRGRFAASGTNVRLIFQPAEEGVRGAMPMVKAGVVDGITAFISCHVGFKATRTGELILGASGFLATSKFDVVYTGVSSHAGAFPQEGKNALLAAASATLGLHAIPRHADGATRITVGRLDAGEGRNIIPGRAHIQAETRGETTELNDFMLEHARRILEHTAKAYDVEYDYRAMGGCAGGKSDAAMVALLGRAARKVAFFDPAMVQDDSDFGASDDVSEFMAAVQAQGGIATYAMVGTELAAGHHNHRFDFNEAAMAPTVELLLNALEELRAGE